MPRSQYDAMMAFLTEQFGKRDTALAEIGSDVRGMTARLDKMNGSVAKAVDRISALEIAQALDSDRHARHDVEQMRGGNRRWDTVKGLIFPALLLIFQAIIVLKVFAGG